MALPGPELTVSVTFGFEQKKVRKLQSSEAWSAGGAAYGGWYLANRLMKQATTEVAFRRLTFRRGEVRTARFAPDGDTIVYSASWDGSPSEIFVAGGRVASVSASPGSAAWVKRRLQA